MSCISKCQRCGSNEMFVEPASVDKHRRNKRVGMQIRVKRYTDSTTCEYALSVCEECAKEIQYVIDNLEKK